MTKKQQILRIDQSPMNPKRWCLELACGHEAWITTVRRPTRKSAVCYDCRAPTEGENEAMQQLSRAVRAALSEIPGFTALPVSGTPRVKPELSPAAMLGMQDTFLQYVTAIGAEMLDERKRDEVSDD